MGPGISDIRGPGISDVVMGPGISDVRGPRISDVVRGLRQCRKSSGCKARRTY